MSAPQRQSAGQSRRPGQASLGSSNTTTASSSSRPASSNTHAASRQPPASYSRSLPMRPTGNSPGAVSSVPATAARSVPSSGTPMRTPSQSCSNVPPAMARTIPASGTAAAGNPNPPVYRDVGMTPSGLAAVTMLNALPTETAPAASFATDWAAQPAKPEQTIAQQSGILPWRFGMEMEMLLRPKEKTMRDLVKIGFDEAITTNSKRNHYLVLLYIRDLFRNNKEFILAFPSADPAKDLTTWKIMGDISLEGPEGWFGVELVSPICSSLDSKAANHLWSIMNTIFSHFTSGSNASCGTHIHVSPYDKEGWSTSRLKRLMSSALYYQEAIVDIMPEKRKEAYFATPNGKKFPSAKIYRAMKAQQKDKKEKRMVKWRHVCEGIDAATTSADVWDAVSLVEHKKYYAWNFRHIKEHTKSSVEFRQPPPSCDYRDTLHWAALVVRFCALALEDNKTAYKAGSTTVPDMASFRDHMKAYEAGAGDHLQGYLNPKKLIKTS